MSRHFKFLAAAGIAAVLGCIPQPTCRGGTVLGVTFFDNELIRIDTTTGVGTLVGTLGTTASPFGLASKGGNLYTFDSNARLILQLDPSTGATVMTYNIGIGPVLGQGGLAFQSSTVGFLTSALDPVTLNPTNDLYRFDLSTGTSTLVTHTADTIEAIAFSPGGMLYGLGKLDGNLYNIDPTVGSMTLLGNVGISLGSPTGGLAFASDGTLFATLDDKLYTLSTTTGLATAVGSSDPTSDTGFSSISGLAFGPAAVPEPSSLVLLAAGAASLLAAHLRRRPVET